MCICVHVMSIDLIVHVIFVDVAKNRRGFAAHPLHTGLYIYIYTHAYMLLQTWWCVSMAMFARINVIWWHTPSLRLFETCKTGPNIQIYPDIAILAIVVQLPMFPLIRKATSMAIILYVIIASVTYISLDRTPLTLLFLSLHRPLREFSIMAMVCWFLTYFEPKPTWKKEVNYFEQKAEIVSLQMLQHARLC